MRAVVFDRDGVLASFDRARAAERLQPLLPFGLGELETRLRGWHAAHGGEPGEPWPRFCEWLGLPALLAVDPMLLLVAYEDARPALERVRADGHKVGVLSNFGLLDLDASLEVLGLTALVDVALSPARLGYAKPAPEAYLGMARALGVEPEECLLLDDRPEHVAGAVAAGLRARRVDRGGAPGALTSLTPLVEGGVEAITG